MTKAIKILKTPEIWIFAIFIILSIIFYPAILRPSSLIPGIGGGDDFGSIYSFWWQIFSRQEGLNPDLNPLINYPYGVAIISSIYP